MLHESVTTEGDGAHELRTYMWLGGEHGSHLTLMLQPISPIWHPHQIIHGMYFRLPPRFGVCRDHLSRFEAKQTLAIKQNARESPGVPLAGGCGPEHQRHPPVACFLLDVPLSLYRLATCQPLHPFLSTPHPSSLPQS